MGAREYRIRRSIEAPASTVWSLLTDAASYRDWNRSVIDLKGPIEQGNTIELVSVVNPKRTFKLKVVEMTEPTRMMWADGMPLGLFKGERTFTITPSGEGCEFSMVEQYSGPLAGLITKAIPDLTDSFTLFADGLKAAAEAKQR